MSEESMDRRVRKTKSQLRQCLTILLQEKKIQDITVRELTDMADLNRGTFYLHYRDVFDLLEQIENELLDQLYQLIVTRQAQDLRTRVSQVFEGIFDLVQENADIVELLLGENGDINFVNRLKQLIREQCLNEWMELFRGTDSRLYDAYYAFIVSGCIGLVTHWLQCNRDVTPRDMAHLTEQMIVDGIGVLEQQ